LGAGGIALSALLAQTPEKGGFMTPAARDAAAMAVLDRWLGGQPLEAALTGWARASRFAGSKDRAAVRDTVFDAVRRKRSCSSLGGALTGRGLLIGLARIRGYGLSGWNGQGYAPPPLTESEQALLNGAVPVLTRGERLDCPDWLLPFLDRALGEQADPTLTAYHGRAPVFLRINLSKAASRPLETVRASLIDELATQGIVARPHPLAKTALLVSGQTRRIKQMDAYLDGRSELQDVASQAVVLDFADTVAPGSSVLDYCAGGGGKALALAALGLEVTAHDIDEKRMRDIPVRARRAGVEIPLLSQVPKTLWPAIFVDAPCSGSGSWRRTPEAKWDFTVEKLQALTQRQDEILSKAAALIAPGGVLGYATCSILVEENEDRVNRFLRASGGWAVIAERRLGPLDGGDGFYLAILQRR
jgi:16S rRNA (cytosine967-C5)-methyltransferase